jgi:hypothetical protein
MLRERLTVSRWSLHRALVRRFGSASWGKGPRRVLIVSHPHRIAHGQIFPFFLYAGELSERYGVSFREVTVDRFESAPNQHRADIVLFQAWWDYGEQRIRRLGERVRDLTPERVALLDAMAPTDLRLAQFVDPFIDVYVKKHALRDRSQYGKTTRGDTTLEDFFGKHHGVELKEKTWPIPPGFLEKLLIGPGFITTPELLPAFTSALPSLDDRPIDLHARLTTKGSAWYQAMRQDCVATVSAIQGVHALTATGVKRRRYLAELRQSKLCYSAFGLGEVAWRDAEAVASGALVLKQDMGHIQTDPDMFVPNETYVPLRWDHGDAEDQVRRFLRDGDARRRIATKAHAVAGEYLRGAGFVPQMARLFG